MQTLRDAVSTTWYIIAYIKALQKYMWKIQINAISMSYIRGVTVYTVLFFNCTLSDISLTKHPTWWITRYVDYSINHIKWSYNEYEQSDIP